MITSAQKASLEHLVPLFKKYRSLFSLPTKQQQAIDFLDKALSSNVRIYLYFEQSKAVGFCCVYRTYSSFAFSAIDTVNDLYVDKSWRRKGIAQKLLAHVELIAKRDDVHSIKVSTQNTNVAANCLYLKKGFVEVTEFNLFSKRVG
jgi:GNAT superfamily N-acetyltransferase